MLLKSTVSSCNIKMKFHPEKIWKNTLWHINSTTSKSTQISILYPLKPHSMQHCWKKILGDIHYANNNRQGETHGVLENQSFSNFKHPSDSSFGSAVSVLCTQVHQNTIGTYFTYLKSQNLETSLQTANNLSTQMVQFNCLFTFLLYYNSYIFNIFCFHKTRNTSISI